MFESVLARGEQIARIEANRAVLRFLNGVDWLIRDPKQVVGRTPYDVVHHRDKLEVRRYRLPAQEWPRKHDLPVLLIPPLMVKPFIFDLYPGRSLVRFLLERGFAVYLIDFGEPDRADAYVTLDDYVLDWIPAACAATKDDAESRDLSLLGYCMGGLFALMHTAANNDRSVRNIVTIGAPLDVNKMGLFAWMAKLGAGQAEFLTRRVGNIPGGVSSVAFRLLTPMKNVTRYGDLFLNMWNREYMNGFDAMNQWVGQFIDYPQGAFLQFVEDFMRHNKLARGKMQFRGKRVDLNRVRAAMLVFAGRTDQIAPPAAVRAVLDATGSRDVTYRPVPGGHMGVFAGASAPQSVWQPTAEWLAARSAAKPQLQRRTARSRDPHTARRPRRVRRSA
jgi:poly[(R)-3-hydroxyalkanoate] polymerase subunit PhaC